MHSIENYPQLNLILLQIKPRSEILLDKDKGWQKRH